MKELSKTEQTKLIIIENYIDWVNHDEAEREQLKKDALLYVQEDHVDEIKQSYSVVKPKRIISVCAKCSDSCSVIFTDSKGIEHDRDSYVPRGIGIDKEDSYGDYVELDIDADTGQILNFPVLSDAQIIRALGK